jgi:predicted site-specific integrase-resolvase
MGTATAVVGCARVSTTDQNLDLQFTALQAVGAARTFPATESADPRWNVIENIGNRVQVSDLSRRTAG